MALSPTTKIKAASLGFAFTPAGRLTLTTVVPVLTSDVTAATSIFYTPYCGNICPVYNGTLWVPREFAELTLALDATGAHTGYHQSGKNFDLFVTDDPTTPGSVLLGTGPAWSSDTARGTGAGTTELQRLGGLLTNKVTMTLRFGSASGNTISVAANQATYVGSFRASADGQTQVKFGSSAAGGGEAWFGIWNNHNRTNVSGLILDSNDTWTYTSASWRAADNSSTFRVSVLSGWAEDSLLAIYECLSSSIQTAAGVGYNATNAKSGVCMTGSVSSGFCYLTGRASAQPLGFNFMSAIEYDVTATGTFYGDAGTAYQQSGLNYNWRF